MIFSSKVRFVDLLLSSVQIPSEIMSEKCVMNYPPLYLCSLLKMEQGKR